MSQINWKGLGVALVTPFTTDNTVDYTALDALIDHVTDGGVDFLVVLGSTGEADLLSLEEKREVLNHVIAKNAGKLPIMAGCFGWNNTKVLCDYIKGFDFTGIDAILSSCPAYIKPTQEGLRLHYQAIAECCPVPVMLYNVPGRTVSNMAWDTTVALCADSDKFIGIKEASSDLIKASHIIYHKSRPDFVVTSGDDETALPMIGAGGDGVISVIANVFPSQTKALVEAALNGNIEVAKQYNQLIYPMHIHLYAEGNPTGIKAALKIEGIGNGRMRLPLLPLTDDRTALLAETMAAIKKQG